MSRLRKTNDLRRHSSYFAPRTVHHDGAADYARDRRRTPLPQRVADDDDPVVEQYAERLQQTTTAAPPPLPPPPPGIAASGCKNPTRVEPHHGQPGWPCSWPANVAAWRGAELITLGRQAIAPDASWGPNTGLQAIRLGVVQGVCTLVRVRQRRGAAWAGGHAADHHRAPPPSTGGVNAVQQTRLAFLSAARRRCPADGAASFSATISSPRAAGQRPQRCHGMVSSRPAQQQSHRGVHRQPLRRPTAATRGCCR